MQTNNNYYKERLHKIWSSPNGLENKKRNLTTDNYKKISSLKAKYNNQRCFIIGGSPSIKNLDLSKLNSEITFSVNRGYKNFDDKFTHSTYHIIQDKLLFEEDDITNEIPLDKIDNLILYAGIDFKKNDDKVIYYDYMHMMNYEHKIFEPDLTKKLVEGYSVIFTCMQIACYMAFSEIYMIGVDLDFNNIKGHSYTDIKGEKRRARKSILNQQIMYDYIEKGVKFLNHINIKVFNASPIGCLDCMPRVNFEELF